MLGPLASVQIFNFQSQEADRAAVHETSLHVTHRPSFAIGFDLNLGWWPALFFCWSCRVLQKCNCVWRADRGLDYESTQWYYQIDGT